MAGGSLRGLPECGREFGLEALAGVPNGSPSSRSQTHAELIRNNPRLYL